jgi:poly(3-hydroxyalkanoate) synthetase
MQLLSSRNYPVIDYQTMGEFVGHERLFRVTSGAFLLHMSSEGKREPEERVVWLTVRDAISWLNEAPDEFGSFWEYAVDPLLEQKQIQHESPAF